jgi:hypothetical protein
MHTERSAPERGNPRDSIPASSDSRATLVPTEGTIMAAVAAHPYLSVEVAPEHIERLREVFASQAETHSWIAFDDGEMGANESAAHATRLAELAGVALSRDGVLSGPREDLRSMLASYLDNIPADISARQTAEQFAAIVWTLRRIEESETA